ncbi:family 32 glycosyltransferase [Hypoxylon trugodes]|uniref:family 32 glycosyltransferase n=1 Tax=Hypoxylon trugodes TaxID=326681 RepID=UPI0021942B58|nr:family 32 glycosyltransferase [Hypoxylon trugodes]KAI1393058.1 family 32 glycosyltransferase [Hypoxylon trugodes]
MLLQLRQMTRTPIWRQPRHLALIFFVFILVAFALTHNSYRKLTPHHRVKPATVENTSLIPRNIWQIFLPPIIPEAVYDIDPEALVDTPSWLAKNPDYTYILVGSEGGDQFVNEYFAHDQNILQTYNRIRNPGLKSDLLRYLILSVKGGTYTDIDTLAIKPIDEWVPKHIRHLVRLIVGLEFDRLDGLQWADIPHDLQFCQWTIAAAPGHPVFTSMANWAVNSINKLVKTYNGTLETLKPSSFEVMTSTGPAAWTDVVFQHLQQAEPELTALTNLSGMTEPRLYGDILVMPIDAFGMGQDHSHSTNDGSIPDAALLKHNFRGSWRDH